MTIATAGLADRVAACVRGARRSRQGVPGAIVVHSPSDDEGAVADHGALPDPFQLHA